MSLSVCRATCRQNGWERGEGADSDNPLESAEGCSIIVTCGVLPSAPMLILR